MSKLLEKIRKNTVVNAQILKNSKYFDNNRRIPTGIPILNLALSGRLNGGMPPGIVQIAAPPKHFKTKFLHQLMYAYQEYYKNEDYIIVLYDSELGSTLEYYEKAGLNTERIDHRPIESVEKLKSDIANLLNDIEEGDKVFICIDSIGMLRSNKETQDAIAEKDAADFTRAKALNSLFRIITPESAIKDIPIAVINHSYTTMDMFPKEVASGGRKTQYAAHSLFFITKAQEKDTDKELVGFTFTLKAGLSRYVKENSTFPVVAFFDSDIIKYSGIFDLAVKHGFIVAETKQTYVIHGIKGLEDVKGKRKTIENDETIMETILKDANFVEKVENDVRI